MNQIETKHPVGDRRDELISRVIDGEANESDWHLLRALAEADPSVWGDLTRTQHQHEALCRVIDEVGVIADGVELPEGELLTPAERFEQKMAGVRAWGGWAAAAAILLVWFTGLPAPTATGPNRIGIEPTSLAEYPDTPDGILDHYVRAGRESGRVLGQMPRRVVLETRPAADGGGVEVVYLRQIVEREVVAPDRLYRLGRDEFGAAALLPDPRPVKVRSSY